jgi:hypothetical protein
MLKKINRKTFLEKYSDFIQASPYRNKYISPETFDSYILYVEAKSTIGLCNNLSKELTKLLKLLQYENVTFLGDTTTPWLFRQHDYKPVKLGLDYLADNKISKSFNGAIQVIDEDLSEFLKHLFWLVRCNGIVIFAHFSDPGFNIMGSICQYGNIHFNTLNEETDRAFNAALEKTGLNISTDNNCGGGRIYKRYSTNISV